MLATPLAGTPEAVLASDRYIFERKLDGMRLLVYIEPAHPQARVHLFSRNGHDKTRQFPEVVRELRRFGAAVGTPLLLDGELVALDARGEPSSFVDLAGRLHERGESAIQQKMSSAPAALFVFDLLLDNGADLRGLPLTDRKARLEKVFHTRGSERLRTTDFSAGDGVRLLQRAVRGRWEGLIAKDATARYESGRRSAAWLKIKVQRQQDFLVGGWTEPRASRAHFGSLVVGYYEPAGTGLVLRPAGSVGSGFTDDDLRRLHGELSHGATTACPFDPEPATMEPVHWVRPELVVQVRFTEWTRDQMLRHPVFLGLRDDVAPTDVRREGDATGPAVVPSKSGSVVIAPQAERPATASVGSRSRRTRKPASSGGEELAPWPGLSDELEQVLSHLEALEAARRNGVVRLPGGASLEVTNLAKAFWPAQQITKGELLRHYVRVSPALLPVLRDRPLIMKRYPNGVTGKSFYQQRAPDDPPAGVRVEVAAEDEEATPRLIGGSLVTLLYMTQLASISQDPWFSRVDSTSADYVALDLDPMPGVPFAQVRDVARFVGDELQALDVRACLKTSGSSGLHIYIPLAGGTSYEAGQLFCRIVATLVATRHPKLATVERAVGARGRTVYVDYLQNILGKSLASAYSARSSEFAGVSAPLAWTELDAGIHPEDVTVRTAMARFRQAGDLWAPMRSHRVDLRAALDRLAARMGNG